MKIEYVPIRDLQEYAGNPRKNDKAVEAVADSIREFGFKVPVVVDKSNVVIAGHTRIRAARQIGMDKIPVIKAEDLTEEQAKAFRLADNKVAEFSNWDFDRLEAELDGLDDEWINKHFIKANENESKAREIDVEEFGEEGFKYECPCCGFRFN